MGCMVKTFLQKSNDIKRRLEAGDIDINEAAGELLIAHGLLISEIEKWIDAIDDLEQDFEAEDLLTYLREEIKTE